MSKRLLAFFLTLVIMLSNVPAFAQESVDTPFVVYYGEGFAEAPKLMLFDVDNGNALNVDWVVDSANGTISTNTRRDMIFEYGHRYSLTVCAQIDNGGIGGGGDIPQYNFATADEALTELYRVYDPNDFYMSMIIPINGRTKDEFYEYLYAEIVLEAESDITEEEVNAEIISRVEDWLMTIYYLNGNVGGGGSYGSLTCYRTWFLGTMTSGSPIADKTISVSDFDDCVPLSVDISSTEGYTAPGLFSRLESGEYIPESFIPIDDVGDDYYGEDIGNEYSIQAGNLNVNAYSSNAGCFMPGSYTLLFGGQIGTKNVLLDDEIIIDENGGDYVIASESEITAPYYGQIQLSLADRLESEWEMGISFNVNFSNITQNLTVMESGNDASVWIKKGKYEKETLLATIFEYVLSGNNSYNAVSYVYANNEPFTIEGENLFVWDLPSLRSESWTATARICDVYLKDLEEFTAGTKAWGGVNIVNGKTSLFAISHTEITGTKTTFTGMTTTVTNKDTGASLGNAVGDETSQGSAFAQFTLPRVTTNLTLTTSFSLPEYDIDLRFSADTLLKIASEEFKSAVVKINGSYPLASYFDGVSVFNLTRTIEGTIENGVMTVEFPEGALDSCYLQFSIGDELIRCTKPISAFSMSNGKITVQASDMPNAGLLKFVYPPYANNVLITANLTFLDAGGNLVGTQSFRKIKSLQDILYTAPEKAVKTKLDLVSNNHTVSAAADIATWNITKGGAVTVSVTLEDNYVETYDHLRVLGVTSAGEEKPITADVQMLLTSETGETYNTLWLYNLNMLNTQDIPAGTYTVTEKESYHLAEPVSITVTGNKGAWSDNVPTLVLYPASHYTIRMELISEKEAAVPDNITVYYWPIAGGGWTKLSGQVHLPYQYHIFEDINPDYQMGFNSGAYIEYVSDPMQANLVDVTAGFKIEFGENFYHINQGTPFRAAEGVLFTSEVDEKMVEQVVNDENDILDYRYTSSPKLEYICTFTKELTSFPDCTLGISLAESYLPDPVRVRAIFVDKETKDVFSHTFKLPAGTYNTEPRNIAFASLPRGTYDLLLLPDESDSTSREAEFAENPEAFTAFENMGEICETVTFTDDEPTVIVEYILADRDNPWTNLRFENTRGTALTDSTITQVLHFSVNRDELINAPSLVFTGESAVKVTCSCSDDIEYSDANVTVNLPKGSGILTGVVEYTYQIPTFDIENHGGYSTLYVHGMDGWRFGKSTMSRMEISSGLTLDMPTDTKTNVISYSGTYNGDKLFVGFWGYTPSGVALNRFGGFAGEMELPASMNKGESIFVQFTTEDATVLARQEIFYRDDEILPSGVEFIYYENKNYRNNFVSVYDTPDASGNFKNLEDSSITLTMETDVQEAVIALEFSPDDSRFVYDPYIVVNGFLYDELYWMYATKSREVEIGTDEDGNVLKARVPVRYEVNIPTKNLKGWSFGYSTYSFDDKEAAAGYRIKDKLDEIAVEENVSPEDIVKELNKGLSYESIRDGSFSCSKNEAIRSGYSDAMDFDYTVTTTTDFRLDTTEEIDEYLLNEGLYSKEGVVCIYDENAVKVNDDFLTQRTFIRNLGYEINDEGKDVLKMEIITVTAYDATDIVSESLLMDNKMTRASSDSALFSDFVENMGQIGGYGEPGTVAMLVNSVASGIEVEGHFAAGVDILQEGATALASSETFLNGSKIKDFAKNHPFRATGDLIPKPIQIGLAVASGTSNIITQKFPDEAKLLEDARYQLNESYKWAIRTCKCLQDNDQAMKIEGIYQEGSKILDEMFDSLQAQEDINSGVDIAMDAADLVTKNPFTALEGYAVKLGVKLVKDVANDTVNTGRWHDVKALMMKYANAMASESMKCDPSQCKPEEPEPEPYDTLEARKGNYSVVERPIRGPKLIIDPSGYVYEGILSNPLEGVVCTIYYSNTAEENSWEVWDASLYKNQINPVVTGKNGYYNWDVPEGFWKIKYEKEGYHTEWSEIMRVPPDRRNVNQAMVPIEASEFYASAYAVPDGIILQYTTPVKASDIVKEKIILLENGVEKACTITVTDKDGELARTVKLTFVHDVKSTYSVRSMNVSSYLNVVCSFDTSVDMNTVITRCAPVSANIASDTIVSEGTAILLSTATVGAEIYYTLDGSCPCIEANASRILYDPANLPIISKDTQIIACAVHPDLEMSETTGFTYFTTARTKRYVTTATADSSSVTAVVSVDLNDVAAKEQPCRIIIGFYRNKYLIGAKIFDNITEASATVCARTEAPIAADDEVIVKVFVVNQDNLVPLCENELFRVYR